MHAAFTSEHNVLNSSSMGKSGRSDPETIDGILLSTQLILSSAAGGSE